MWEVADPGHTGLWVALLTLWHNYRSPLHLIHATLSQGEGFDIVWKLWLKTGGDDDDDDNEEDEDSYDLIWLINLRQLYEGAWMCRQALSNLSW